MRLTRILFRMTDTSPLPSPLDERAIHVLAIIAFAVWCIAGILPALDEDIGFAAWLYGLFFIFPIGAITTVANGHVLIAAINAFRYFNREIMVPQRFPLIGLLGIIGVLAFMIMDITTPNQHVSDPSIPEPEFKYGAYVYMAALGVSLLRMVLLVWKRASDSPL